MLPRKRMQESMPRRQSSRIEKLAKEKEETAKVLAKEEEERKVKETEERERRQRYLFLFIQSNNATFLRDLVNTTIPIAFW